MRYSVKRIPLKAALLYMTVFVIILAAHGGITFWNVTGSLEKELNQANMALLRQMNQKIDMTLREIDKLTLDLVQGSEVNQFVENPNLTEPDKLALFNSISEQMRSRTYANDMVHSIYLYSMVNGLIATNSRLTNRADFFDTGWLERSQRLQGFANWLPSRPVVMNPNTDSAFEKKFITLIRSYPFNASGDSRKGVIALNIDESKLARMVRDEHEGPGFGTLFIADAEENLISLDDNKEDAALDIRQAGYTALLEKGAPEGFTKLELNGKEAIVYHTVSPYNGWRYVGILFNPELNKGVEVMGNLLLFTAAAMVLVALASVLTISRWFFRPLESFMQKVMNQAEKAPFQGMGRSSGSQAGNLDYLEHYFTEVVKENEAMQVQIRDSRPALKWRLATELLMGYRVDPEKEKAAMQTAGIELLARYFIVMTAQLDPVRPDPSPKDLRLYMYGLCNIAEEFMNAEGKGTAIQLDERRAAFIMSFEESNAHSQLLTALSVADLIKNAVHHHFRRSISIGVGRTYEEMKDIKLSYQESLDSLKYNLVMGHNTVIAYEDIEPSTDRAMLKAYTIVDKVAEHAKSGSREKMLESLELLFRRETTFKPDLLRPLCLHVIMESLMAVSGSGIEVEELLGSSADSINDRLSQLDTAAQLKSYTAGVLEQFVETAQARKTVPERTESAERMLGFIHSHYHQSDLSLNLLADEFKLSLSHLSRVFKEQVGTNFMDYLIQVRMGEAKRLLLETDKRVNEISEEVGYSNTYSFIRIFKKHTGMTPGEFRERHMTGLGT